MLMVEWEYNQILFYYNVGMISLEVKNKLLNDITPILWDNQNIILIEG